MVSMGCSKCRMGAFYCRQLGSHSVQPNYLRTEICLQRFGPLPYASTRRLPLPPGAYTSLVAHSFLNFFLLLRIFSIGGRSRPLTTISYTLLAWAVPFLLLSHLVFPVGMPLLNPITSAIATPIDATKAQPIAATYTSTRFRTLKILNERIQAFAPLLPFLLVTVLALFWAVNGQVERYDPKPSFSIPSLLYSSIFAIDAYPIGRTVSPIEVRSALAIAFVAISLLGWLSGDIRTISTIEREAEIETAAQLERLRIVRCFAPAEGESIPLPSPWNIVGVVARDAPCLIMRSLGRATSWKSVFNRWVLRFAVAPQLAAVDWFMRRGRRRAL